ncbi:hypothetical protein ACFFQF_08070 [Haladaptatus pallidirubidus]|uniref:hypothetical protein n=1 Tax=Haladaptatus pallidirubidus TaxID=1008152 RepID=UPI0035EE4EDE
MLFWSGVFGDEGFDHDSESDSVVVAVVDADVVVAVVDADVVVVEESELSVVVVCSAGGSP